MMHQLMRELRSFHTDRSSNKFEASTWENFSNYVLQNVDAPAHVFESACRTLRDSKSFVSKETWRNFSSSLLQKLVDTRLDLLESVSDIVHPTKTDEKSETLKRSPSIEIVSENVRKKKKVIDLDEQLQQPADTEKSTEYAFRLLKGKNPCFEYDLSLRDIIVRGAELSIIGNYQYDLKWMWESVPELQTSKKILLIHGENKEEEAEWQSFLSNQGFEKRAKFVRPQTPNYGTVHSKFFILCFPTACRVCIHTANMIQRDWEVKVQGAYIRDFPLREEVSTTQKSNNLDCDFRHRLLDYLSHCMDKTSYEEIYRFLNRYDFSSAGVALVTSVPGIHKDNRKEDFGHPRLRKILRTEPIPEDSPSAVVCQFSSLGSIQEPWINQEFSDTLFASSSSTDNSRNDRDIQLVFPTVEQVLKSKEGVIGGTSLPVPEGNISRQHILSKLHIWEATFRERATEIPHIKTFMRYSTKKPHQPFWLFLGSFNLSVAAWGRMYGHTKKTTTWNRVRILSYEMGVLFTPRLYNRPQHYLSETVPYNRNLATRAEKTYLESSSISFVLQDADSTKVHDETTNSRYGTTLVHLPVPYRVPPQKYKRGDVPWTTTILFM